MLPLTSVTDQARCRIADVEAAAQRDVGRHVASLAAHARGGLFDAASSLAAATGVVLVTGCFIPDARPPAAETDGPPGAALLGATLAALGVPVRLLTDHHCAEVVRAAAAAVAAPLPLDVLRADGGLAGLADGYARAGVSHVVYVERLGPGADGRVRNMHGEDVTASTPPLHALAQAGPWTTIGLGDGGNEVGMGRLSRAAFAPAVETIRCVVPCDVLVVAGVSNWGAIGLGLALALLREEPALVPLLGPARHDAVLAATVAAGGVDGVRGVPVESVDDVAGEVHREVIGEMVALAAPQKGGGG